MKLLVCTLLLVGGLNAILARSLYWGPYHRPVANPWVNYDYSDELFALPSRQNSHEQREFKQIPFPFRTNNELDELINAVLSDDDNNSDSKEKTKNESSEERHEGEDVETLKELESFFNAMLGVHVISEDDTKSAESTETTKENDNDDDDGNDDNKNDEDNTAETDNSVVHIIVMNENESKESKETLTPNNSEEEEYDDDEVKTIFSSPQATTISDDQLERHDTKVSEKDIRELTALLITLSTLDDLMRIAENTPDNEHSLNDDELNEKKLKEVDDYFSLFNTLFDKISDESTENKKETNESANDDDDDNDSKQKNHDNDDSSVSVEVHGIENSKTNLEKHRYNVVQRSIAAVEQKPTTSSPYLTETYASTADNNKVIQEYVEVRDKLDTLQDNLLLNKLNMDKDFYNIIANEDDDQYMNNFTKDVSNLRDNAYKFKQTIDDMQDIKSKLYFRKLIRTALKGTPLN